MLLDISTPVTPETATWPGDARFECGWTTTKKESGSVNVGWAKQSAHVGTHVDAPFHFDDAGQRVGGLPLDAFVGPCVVIDAVGQTKLDASLMPRRAERVLIKTTNSSDPTKFRTDFPLLTNDAVAALARGGAKLVGLDAPSYDAVDSKTLPIHHALAREGIVNVENLVLDAVTAGPYELLAAPLHWPQMDAAPLRALLRK